MLCIWTSSAVTSISVVAAVSRVMVGRLLPTPIPMTVTPATSNVMAAAAEMVSVWPGATRITSPLDAVHLPMAPSRVAAGCLGLVAALPFEAASAPESTWNTLPVVSSGLPIPPRPSTGTPRLFTPDGKFVGITSSPF